MSKDDTVIRRFRFVVNINLRIARKREEPAYPPRRASARASAKPALIALPRTTDHQRPTRA